MKSFLEKAEKWRWDWLLVILMFAGILFINYLDVLKYHYYVPPGTDSAVHTSIVKKILSGESLRDVVYPPGFHYFIALLTKILHSDPIKIMVYFYPSLMFFSTIAVYLFARAFFDKTTAFLVLFLYGFISPAPRFTPLWDGGFPNLLGADFLMVLGFLYFLKAYQTERLKESLLAGLFIGLVPFFHHFSTYLMTILIFGLSLALLFFSFFKKDNLPKKLLVLFSIFLVAFLLGIYPSYVYFGRFFLQEIALRFTVYAASLEGLLKHSTGLQKNSEAIPLSDYALVLSPYLWYLGWLSLPFVFRGIIKEKKTEYLFVFVWFLLVSILSRPVALSPLPGRVAREIAIPLVFLSAIGIKEFTLFFKSRWQRFTIVAAIAIFLFVGLTDLSSWVGKYNYMIFVSGLDKQALDWVKENTPKDALFAVAPHQVWFNLLTERPAVEIGIDLSNIKNFDYLYINRWQRGWLWGFDPTDYRLVRQKAAFSKELELMKTFGEANEKGIAIYKVRRNGL